jgi:MarR family transcriptional regulator, 2-MHQ and catechol-resistance regulon repressor
MSTNEKLDRSGVHLWLVLWKTARAVEAHSSRSIARFGCGPTDFAVLEVLLHKGPLTVKQIGEKVLLTSGSMTAAVDRLELRGLVARHNDATDRRARVIALTEAGREFIERVFADHASAMENAVAGFLEGDRILLLSLLRQLGRTAEKNFNNDQPTSTSERS